MSAPRERKIDAIALAIIGATSMFPNRELAARYYAEKALNALEDFDTAAEAEVERLREALVRLLQFARGNPVVLDIIHDALEASSEPRP